jgi:hypothetical protein
VSLTWLDPRRAEEFGRERLPADHLVIWKRPLLAYGFTEAEVAPRLLTRMRLAWEGFDRRGYDLSFGNPEDRVAREGARSEILYDAAEICSCGHPREAHFAMVASCSSPDCRCGDFALRRAP